MKVLAKKQKKKKKKKRINGNTYKDKTERSGRWTLPTVSERPSLALSLSPATRLSLSLQLTMYNYKVYEKVSNINRQKYTELIFTCLIDVRKLSYTHTITKKKKLKKITLSDL